MSIPDYINQNCEVRRDRTRKSCKISHLTQMVINGYNYIPDCDETYMFQNALTNKRITTNRKNVIMSSKLLEKLGAEKIKLMKI